MTDINNTRRAYGTIAIQHRLNEGVIEWALSDRPEEVFRCKEEMIKKRNIPPYSGVIFVAGENGELIPYQQ